MPNDSNSPKRGAAKWTGHIKQVSQSSAIRSICEGLGVELVRDVIKWGLMAIGGMGLTIIFSGLGDLTWSLRGFKLFGAVNTVEAPNQNIGSDAVHRLPFDTSVRLKGGAFLALNRGYRGQIEAVVTSDTGHHEDRYIAPSTPMFTEVGCDLFGIHLMEKPDREATSGLVLYTVAPVDDEDCRGFWTRWMR